MIKNSHKGYLAPWSSRRENVGLIGALIIFLARVPARSELSIESTKLLVRHLVRLMLVFLGLATPTQQIPVTPVAPPVHVVHVKPAHAHVNVKRDPNSMFLRTDPALHHYIYNFKGRATLNGQPCAKASVLIRLQAGDTTVAKGTVSEADGSYSLEVAIDAKDQSPVDWVVQAYTPDFKKVELSGRQIVQREEEQKKQPIIVTNPVEFVVTLSE
jgi:hypothetical protein